jgi:hypothetical protein
MVEEKQVTDVFPKPVEWKSQLGKVYQLRTFIIDDYLEVLEDVFAVVTQVFNSNPELDLAKFSASDFSAFLPVMKEVKTIIGKFCGTPAEEVGKELTAKDMSELVGKFFELNSFEDILQNFTLAKNYLAQMKKSE